MTVSRRAAQQQSALMNAAHSSPAQMTPGSPWAAVWASREYRGLLAAHFVTLCGDQLARVALVVLVFGATASAVGAAAAYAVTFLPELFGGPLLAGLADRYPRRTVMVCCDVGSAALTAVMAIRGLPLPVLFALVFTTVVLHSPFAAARSALVKDVFNDRDQYTAALSLSQTTFRAAQIAGFGGGGLVVALLGPRPALLLDAATFAASAALVWLLVAHRPAARTGASHAGQLAQLRGGLWLVFGDRRLRRLTFYAWLAGFHAGPEAVVAPLAASRGGGPGAVGALLAATAMGSVLSTVALAGVGEQRRMRLLGPLAVLAGAALIPCALNPSLPIIAVLWAVSGIGIGYQVIANTAFVCAVPRDRRGQAFGLVSTGMMAGQGLAFLLAGALAQTLNPTLVVAGFGAAGTLAALTLTLTATGGGNEPTHAGAAGVPRGVTEPTAQATQ